MNYQNGSLKLPENAMILKVKNNRVNLPLGDEVLSTI